MSWQHLNQPQGWIGVISLSLSLSLKDLFGFEQLGFLFSSPLVYALLPRLEGSYEPAAEPMSSCSRTATMESY